MPKLILISIISHGLSPSGNGGSLFGPALARQWPPTLRSRLSPTSASSPEPLFYKAAFPHPLRFIQLPRPFPSSPPRLFAPSLLGRLTLLPLLVIFMRPSRRSMHAQLKPSRSQSLWVTSPRKLSIQCPRLSTVLS